MSPALILGDLRISRSHTLYSAKRAGLVARYGSGDYALNVCLDLISIVFAFILPLESHMIPL